MKFSLEITNDNMPHEEFHIFCLCLCLGEDCRLTDEGVIYEGLEEKDADEKAGEVERFYREKVKVFFENSLLFFNDPQLPRRYFLRRVNEREEGQDT
jgi:hypothetical protein